MADPKPLFRKLADLLGTHADQRVEELANRTLRTGREHWSLGSDYRPMSEADFEPYILSGTEDSVGGIPHWRLKNLDETRAPQERLWEFHTHPSNMIAPSPEDVNFWRKYPGFSHGIVGPGELVQHPASVRETQDLGIVQPGFAVWQAPHTFYSPQAFSRAENQARYAMNNYEKDLQSIYRRQPGLEDDPSIAPDYLAPYLGMEMQAKEAGPRVKLTREYPWEPYLNPNEAVDELMDFFSKKNRFAQGGQVPGARLLEPPPFTHDPLRESLRPVGPVGTMDVSSLLASTKPRDPGMDQKGLEALLARLATPAPGAVPATPPAASAIPQDVATPYDEYLKKIRVPDPSAVNPDTGATSAYDFIPYAFREVVRKNFPDLAKLSDEELNGLMKDERVAKQAALALTQMNERHLLSAGIPASDYTRYLAHWFGPAGAVSLLTGDDKKTMDDWFEGYYPGKGTRWAKANGLAGKTVAEALAMARKRMGGR